MEFGLNCVTFKGSSLTDRRLAVGDFGGRVYSFDFEENKEVWGLRGHEVVNCIDGAGGNGVGPAEIVTGKIFLCIRRVGQWNSRSLSKGEG